MLDRIREHSRSTIIYVLFGSIIGVFVFTFNTGGNSDCGSTGQVIMARAGGQDIDSGVLQMGMALTAEEPNPLANDIEGMRRAYVYNHTRFPQLGGDPAYSIYIMDAADLSPIKVERALDDLIETWLVSEEARAMGLAVPADELRDRVYSKGWYDEQTGKFRKQDFNNYVSFGLKTNLIGYENFIERELLREKAIDVVTAGATVDADELAYYVDLQNTKVDLEYIEIDPARFVATVSVDAGAIDKVLADRAAELEPYYDAHKSDFAGESYLFRGLRLAYDGTSRAAVATEAARLAGELSVLSGEERVARFASAAAAFSSHDASKGNGGLMGDYIKDVDLAKAPFGQALADKLAMLRDGALSAPVLVKDAFWIVDRVGARATDPRPFAEVKREIARRLAAGDKTPEAAKAFAAKVEGWIATHPKASMTELAAHLDVSLPGSKSPFEVATTGPFARMSAYALGQDAAMSGAIPQIGVAPELLSLAFSLSEGAPLAAKVLPVEPSGRYFAVRLKERVLPSGDEAETAKKDLRDVLVRVEKRNSYLAWYKGLKAEAAAAGDLEYTADFQSMMAAERSRYDDMLKKKLESAGGLGAIQLTPPTE